MLKPILSLCFICFLVLLSCDKDLNIQEDENLSVETIAIKEEINTTFEAKKTCVNKATETLCACGKTEAEAKLKLAAKARIDCAGKCLEQDCNNDKTCNLKKVGPKKSTATCKQKEVEIDNEVKILWEACASFTCYCKCRSCGKNLQVAKEETATSIDSTAAYAMAAEKAKTWCSTVGCPTFQSSCKKSKKCNSIANPVAKKISKERVMGSVPNTFEWKVTVLITACNCGCR